MDDVEVFVGSVPSDRNKQLGAPSGLEQWKAVQQRNELAGYLAAGFPSSFCGEQVLLRMEGLVSLMPIRLMCQRAENDL